ncbi:MAG: cardiolipin synthase [SAR86 cluster bacterium]|uniref:Cardiolipin synthase n=1 Tax=SAR86 cluster bacterium TaxID=2030880 RepID=A0A2A5B7Y9_9GAMM|nr:MAG: cardiolipin synthase [SAR86 cluster bacterium]
MFTLSIGFIVGAISLIAATHALLNKRDSISALAWVSFCLILPLLGPVIYLLFGINRITSKAQRLYLIKNLKEQAETIPEPVGTHFRPRSLVGEIVTGAGLCSCTDIQILENGEALYPAMLKDIGEAKSRIYLSTYLFQNDSTGKQFAIALSCAQLRGVDVRILVDGLGAIAYPPRISKKLRELNLNFKQFDPVRLIPPSLHINMRNHRKILLIDGESVYTGGQNISDRHLLKKPDNPIPTLDLHFRFTGRIVDDLEHAFLKDWNNCPDVTDEQPLLPARTNNPESQIWTRLILDGPNENLDKLNELLVGVLSSATKRIWIMTPYFLPGFDLLGALVGARLRGVDVKILLPQRTNIHLAHWAAQHNLRHILAKGLKVYSQPAPFIHTKAILIDDNYALIGSANLDPRSLRLNFELGVEIFSKDFNHAISDYFEEKLKTSIKVDENNLRARPSWVRIRDAVAWLFTPYL